MYQFINATYLSNHAFRQYLLIIQSENYQDYGNAPILMTYLIATVRVRPNKKIFNIDLPFVDKRLPK